MNLSLQDPLFVAFNAESNALLGLGLEAVDSIILFATSSFFAASPLGTVPLTFREVSAYLVTPSYSVPRMASACEGLELANLAFKYLQLRHMGIMQPRNHHRLAYINKLFSLSKILLPTLSLVNLCRVLNVSGYRQTERRE
jgi:hypothetical protein